MDLNPVSTPNPLLSFIRQPKIYITLPSQGQFWPADSLELSSSGEYAVYSMTARDELLLKVPDALMNGQAVVDVIQNCVPNIKNAWDCPTIDLDVILVAIRIATYGEMMTTPIKFGSELELDYQMDLRRVMDQLINQISWNSTVPITNEMTVFVKPLTYKELAGSALQTFETQKILQIVNDEKMTEEEKLRLFKESFAKLTTVTLGTVTQSIYKIDTVSGSTSNKSHIEEFIDNVDKDVFNKIQDHLDKLREQNSLKPIEVAVTDEMREAGFTGDTVEVPITFDASTFFV
jgi:hypothetical protein